MKLHWSPRSPYVRKVMIVAHETGTLPRIELMRSVAAMAQPNDAIMRDNPLSKIPTLVLDDGSALYDSVVICEHLDSLHAGAKFFPADAAARWPALRLHALANGTMDILILWRNELLRPPAGQAPALLTAFAKKTDAALAVLVKELKASEGAFNIGHVAALCCLGYLDFRFPQIDWRAQHPFLKSWFEKMSQRPSFQATAASDDQAADAPSAKRLAQ